NHQRLIHLREIEGWSCEAIAEAEGTNVESARAALYRARQRLREAYNRAAAGALSIAAFAPLRDARRRLEWWLHSASQLASASPAITARAGDAIAAVVAVAVVSAGASAQGTVTPVPQGVV